MSVQEGGVCQLRGDESGLRVWFGSVEALWSELGA